MKNSDFLQLDLFIHDLNHWGGQDRSVLEIAKRLSHSWKVNAFCYSLEDRGFPQDWGQIQRIRIRPNLRRPVFLKIIYFHLAAALLVSFFRLKERHARRVCHATGSSSLRNDVIQVQFVQSAWWERRHLLPSEHPGEGVRPKLKRLYHSLLLRFNILCERMLFRKGKHYIAIAEGVKKELHEFFGVGDRVHVIHHGVDPKAFCPPSEDPSGLLMRQTLRESLGIGQDEKVICFVGTFDRKGLTAAIDAFASLEPALRRGVRLLAVGTGDFDGYRLRIREKALGDQVILVGHQKQIIPYYWASDAFLLPTLYEPFGLVILEAMSCGLTPIVSSCAGASELIENGTNGFLIQDPTDIREVAARVGQWLRLSPPGRLQAAQAARETAKRRSWDQVAREYDEFLKRVAPP